MPVTTVYTCDKCEAIVADPRQYYRLQLVLSTWFPPAGGAMYHVSAEKHEGGWCRQCVVEAGMLPPADGHPAPEAEPATLEDLVIELIDERIAEKTGAV